MVDDRDLGSRVREANKEFYNTAADIYEQADGRRTGSLDRWIDRTLQRLSRAAGSGTLLDIGCGTGIILKSGKKYFSGLYGIDIALEILKRMKTGNGICGDCAALPLKNGSVNVAVCFAVLHHIYDHTGLLKETYRILKKGGVLYIDHDMDKVFAGRFYGLIKLYRSLHNAAKRYSKLSSGLTEELYNLSEVHSKGVNVDGVIRTLNEAGFSDIRRRYHWFGLNPVSNAFFGNREFARGFAPLFSIEATK
ncbi:MAG: methyltransferase domain-containing protein [Candidatus Omnitrophota bacterium]